MRTTRRLGGVLLAGGLLLAGSLLTSGAAPALAADPPALQLGPPTLSSDRVVTVPATVPAGLAGRDLPDGSFTATQDGAPVPVSATRAVDGPAELLLVLDTAAGSAALTAEQSAAADLLRSLPAQTPTTVLPGGERTTARGALDRVGALRTSTGTSLLDGLPAAPAGRRYAVVLTNCPTLNAERRGIPGENTQVSVLSVGPGCEASAPALAGREPGVVRTGLDTGGLLASVDEVARAVLGQYVVRSQGPVGAGPLQVTLTSGTSTARATVDLPAAAASTGGGSGSDDDPVWPVVVAAVLAGLVAVLLALEVGARRRVTPA